MTPGTLYAISVKRPRGPVIEYLARYVRKVGDTLVFTLADTHVTLVIDPAVLEGDPQEVGDAQG